MESSKSDSDSVSTTFLDLGMGFAIGLAVADFLGPIFFGVFGALLLLDPFFLAGLKSSSETWSFSLALCKSLLDFLELFFFVFFSRSDSAAELWERLLVDFLEA